MLIATAALAALAAVPAAGAIALQTTTPVKVHVTPGTGGPRTAFKVSFRSPAQTGRVGSMQRSERVEIQGRIIPGAWGRARWPCRRGGPAGRQPLAHAGQ